MVKFFAESIFCKMAFVHEIKKNNITRFVVSSFVTKMKQTENYVPGKHYAEYFCYNFKTNLNNR